MSNFKRDVFTTNTYYNFNMTEEPFILPIVSIFASKSTVLTSIVYSIQVAKDLFLKNYAVVPTYLLPNLMSEPF